MHLQKTAIISQYVWRQRVAQRKFGKLKMIARKKVSLQLESVPKVKRIDWIDVDNFLCILPCLVDLVNNLRISIIWSSCLKEFKFESHVRLLIYLVFDSLV